MCTAEAGSVAFCSAPAASPCAAVTLGTLRDWVRDPSNSRSENSCSSAIALQVRLLRSTIGAVLGNSPKVPGPTRPLAGRVGLDSRVRPFLRRSVLLRRLPDTPCPRKCRGSPRASPFWSVSTRGWCRTPNVCVRTALGGRLGSSGRRGLHPRLRGCVCRSFAARRREAGARQGPPTSTV